MPPNVPGVAPKAVASAVKILVEVVRDRDGDVSGQIGDGTTSERPKPTLIPAYSAYGITAGNGFSCARSVGIQCWGDNSGGQFGDGATGTSSKPKAAATGVGGGDPVADAYHACARRSDGCVSCWGVNTSGQLGDGTTTNRPTPVSAGR